MPPLSGGKLLALDSHLKDGDDTEIETFLQLDR
jgi:hypothetical protein